MNCKAEVTHMTVVWGVNPSGQTLNSSPVAASEGNGLGGIKRVKINLHQVCGCC